MRLKLKKAAALIGCVSLILSVVGCSGSNVGETSAVEPSSAAETDTTTAETTKEDTTAAEENTVPETTEELSEETSEEILEETTDVSEQIVNVLPYGAESIEELEWTFGATVGRVSLDQEMFETTMGDLGNQRIQAEGDLEEYQKNILWACQITPAAPAHYCAAWIASVFQNIGVYSVYGNANDIWANVCYSSDFNELEPGMIIAVQHSRTDTDSDGYIYGHVGIYIGRGYVIASTTVEGSGMKVITSLDDWLDRYDPYGTVAWGYPSGL